MGNIRITLAAARPAIGDSIACLERAAGLDTAGVGERVAKALGTSPKSEATIYGYFKRGVRKYTADKVAALASALGADVAAIEEMNERIENGCVSVEIPDDIDVRDLVQHAPDEIKSIADFILWADLECKRRKLLAQDQ